MLISSRIRGFDAYYLPSSAEKLVSGALVFFNIYYSWYFNFYCWFFANSFSRHRRFPTVGTSFHSSQSTATRACCGAAPNATSRPVPGEVRPRTDQGFFEVGLNLLITPFGTPTTQRMMRAGTIPKRTHRRPLSLGESGRLNRVGAYIVPLCLLPFFLELYRAAERF